MDLPKIPALEGADDMFRLLSVFEDDQKRARAMEWVRAVLEARDQYLDAVRKLAKAEEIDGLYERAQADRKLAREAVENASDEAAMIVAKANQDIEADRKRLKDDIAAFEKRSREEIRELNIREENVAAREQEADERLREAEKREKAAAEKIRKADAAMKEAEDIKAKARALVNG